MSGAYAPPAERMRAIREVESAVGGELYPGWRYPFWLGLSILAVPGADEVPPVIRTDPARLRQYIARRDWKARCKAKRQISLRFRRVAIQRANGRCTYCPAPVADEDYVIDHVAPVSRGGRSRLRNLVASCHRCNADKLDQLDWEGRDVA